MDALDAIKKTFFEECEEQLAEMEAGLAAMNDGSTDVELVNGVFRAVHSIKGGAGAFKLNALVSFAHKFETVLDLIRSSRLESSPQTLRVMLRALDVLADLVRLSRADAEIEDAKWVPLATELEACITEPAGSKAPEPVDAATEPAPEADATPDFGFDFTPTPILLDAAEPAPAQPQLNTFAIHFRPFAELYASANEPTVLLRELAKLGTVAVTCHADDVQPLPTIDTNASRLHWTVRLQTTHDAEAIREIFEFVDGACELTIGPATAEADGSPTPQVGPDFPLAETAAEEHPVIASAPVAVAPSAGAKPDAQPEAAPQAAAVERETPHAADPSSTALRAAAPGAGAAAAPAASPTIRVDLDRVDRLINLVGELVINQAMLSQRVMAEGLAKSSSAMIGLDELEQLTREIQESVMAIRAQPIKPLFQRMSRTVREACEATGKNVRLRLEGEMTELDKTVIERLADPLTHMIRNAVDHGIESEAKRVAAGKNPEGVVKLSAAHRSGRVQIEIADDGGGIDRKRVLAKAIDKGLVPPGTELPEPEIDNLLFLPGFSTADSVSNLSGRGVGMDVVRRAIQALGGRITISSQPGAGSTFVLSLPLTLAVLDGMVVTVAGQTLVVPLTAIIETLRPTAASLHPLGGAARVLKVRDQFVPLIDVAAELGFDRGGRPHDDESGVAILVESESAATHALLVDSIEDQRQVVIKSIESNYGKIEGIAAATILGDGRVALILDVEDVVSISRNEQLNLKSELRLAGGAR